MNKKLVTLLTTSIIAASSAAYAIDSYSLNPYIGADYQYTYMNYTDESDGVIDDNFNGFNIYGGIRPYANIGLELGYFRNFEEDGIESGIPVYFNTQGVTLDALGYLPIDRNGRIELIGTVGVSYAEAKVGLNFGGSRVSVSEDEFGFRIGAGVEYKINQNFSARTILRYQTADFEGLADNAVVYNVGLNYKF